MFLNRPGFKPQLPHDLATHVPEQDPFLCLGLGTGKWATPISLTPNRKVFIMRVKTRSVSSVETTPQ